MKQNHFFLKSAVVAFAMNAAVLAPLSSFAITLEERDAQAVRITATRGQPIETK